MTASNVFSRVCWQWVIISNAGRGFTVAAGRVVKGRPSEGRVCEPPRLLGGKAPTLDEGIVCKIAPLASAAEVCDAHVRGQSTQQLHHPQHEEHVTRKLLDAHFLQGGVRVKGVHPGSSEQALAEGET